MTTNLCGTKTITDWFEGCTFHDNSVPFLNKLSLEVLTQNRINMQRHDFRTTEKKAVQNIKICQE